eukprot:s1283_g24.t1
MGMSCKLSLKPPRYHQRSSTTLDLVTLAAAMAVTPALPSPSLQLGFTLVPAESRGDGPKPAPAPETKTSTALFLRFEELQGLQHPNLARYLELLLARDGLVFIASEHSSLSLKAALTHQPAGFSSQKALQICAQLLRGLCYLNSRGLVHGRLDSTSVIFQEKVTEQHCDVLLTGHGLGQLLGYGQLSQSPLTPSDPCCLAPEVAGASAASFWPPSCQHDVWSLGILLLQMLQGPWLEMSTADLSSPKHRYCCRVAAETAIALGRLSSATAGAAPTLPLLLQNSSGQHGVTGGDATRPGLPFLESLTIEDSRELQKSYRTWLRAETLEAQLEPSVKDFWEECLTLKASQRPKPSDLASHPCMALESCQETGEGWSPYAKLQIGGGTGPEPEDETTAPGRYLRSIGVDVSQLSYWWRLAGGSPYRVAAERLLLRPTPPILRLPLVVLDGEAAGSQERSTFLESFIQGEEFSEEKSHGSQGIKFWDPPKEAPFSTFSVDLTPLCRGFRAAERANAADLRPESIYARHRHFSYQWLRVKRFARLLAAPSRRVELLREAEEDLPPVLRDQIWSALLGGSPLLQSDELCWSPFYEKLVTAPLTPEPRGSGNYLLERAGGSPPSVLEDEKWKVALRSVPSHLSISEPGTCRSKLGRLDRLIYALLAANPSLQHAEGLGALCAVLSSVLRCEESAFLAAQRLLHGFLWPFYGPDSVAFRRRNLQLFNSLMSFVDPQLSLHLQELGLQGDAYASDWFPTWFAQLLPLSQVMLLWDRLLLQPPQFQLFVAVCLVHFFRESLLSLDEASHICTFLSSCAQLIDSQILVTAALDFFTAVPASITLAIYPRHSAGEALLWEEGKAPIAADSAWGYLSSIFSQTQGETEEDVHRKESLVQHATEQWRQCEWWRQRSNSTTTPPLITVDDLLSYRSRCFILDVRSAEEFENCHFQSSVHVSDPDACDLRSPSLPTEFATQCGTPGNESDGEPPAVAAPWLFGKPRALRLVVVIGGEDFGISFAEHLLNAGVRHVLCLLGGLEAVLHEAPSYLSRVETRGAAVKNGGGCGVGTVGVGGTKQVEGESKEFGQVSRWSVLEDLTHRLSQVEDLLRHIESHFRDFQTQTTRSVHLSVFPGPSFNEAPSIHSPLGSTMELPECSMVCSVTTVCAVLASRVFLWDFHRELPFAYQVLSATLGRTPGLVNSAQEKQLNGRVVEGRQRTFKAIATLWGLAADLYFCLLPFAASSMLTAPHFWAGLGGAVVIRWCAHPSVHLRPGDVEKVLVFLNAMSVGIQYSLPRQLLPALSSGRLLLSVMFLDPWQAVNSNILLSPLFTYASLANESIDALSIFLAIMNEAFFLLLSSLVCFYLDASLRRQESSTMKMEAKTKEAEANMTAAQKLLNVTCDACVHVTNDFHIKKPHRALLDLLGADEVEGKSLLEFIGASDRSRFLDAFASDVSEASAPAKSLTVQMLDAQGTASEARLYHVQVPTFVLGAEISGTEHLLGISEVGESHDSATGLAGLAAEGRRNSRGSADVKPLVPGMAPTDLEQFSRQTSSPRSAVWKPLKGLENVKLTIDATSTNSVHDGFRISSAEFNFSHKEDSSLVPNLMEWVQPQARHRLQCWIQDHVNAFACGKLCETTLERVVMLDPVGHDALLAGCMSACKLMVGTSPDGSGLSGPSGLSEAETMGSTGDGDNSEGDSWEEEGDDDCDIFLQIAASDFYTAT